MLSVPPDSASTAKAKREQKFSTATAPKIDSGTDIMMISQVAEALELGRQHEIDDDEREAEHDEKRVAGLDLRARLAGIFDEEALRHDFAGNLLQRERGPRPT